MPFSLKPNKATRPKKPTFLKVFMVLVIVLGLTFIVWYGWSVAKIFGPKRSATQIRAATTEAKTEFSELQSQLKAYFLKEHRLPGSLFDIVDEPDSSLVRPNDTSFEYIYSAEPDYQSGPPCKYTLQLVYSYTPLISDTGDVTVTVFDVSEDLCDKNDLAAKEAQVSGAIAEANTDFSELKGAIEAYYEKYKAYPSNLYKLREIKISLSSITSSYDIASYRYAVSDCAYSLALDLKLNPAGGELPSISGSHCH